MRIKNQSKENFFNSINLSIKGMVLINISMFLCLFVLYSFVYYRIPEAWMALFQYSDFIWFALFSISIIIVVKYRLKNLNFIGLKQSGLKRDIKFALALIFFIYLIKFSLILISRKYSLLVDEEALKFLISDTAWLSLLHIFIAISLGPIIEEIIFRGFFYPPLRKKLGVSPAIIISALLFMLWHLGSGNLVILFNIFLVGVLLSYLYEKTISLIPSMTVHIIINLSWVIPILFRGKISSNPSRFTLSMLLIFLVLTTLFYIAYRRASVNNDKANTHGG